MVILIAALLTALVVLWLGYPLWLRNVVASESDVAVIHEELEREIDDVRTGSGTALENSPKM